MTLICMILASYNLRFLSFFGSIFAKTSTSTAIRGCKKSPIILSDVPYFTLWWGKKIMISYKIKKIEV